MNKNKLTAVIFMLVGAFMIYWAQTHSPTAKIGQIVGNELSGSYTMSETWYYISLILSVGVIGYGAYKFFTGK